MKLSKNTKEENIPRVCTRCSSIVNFAQVCEKCYDFFIHAPKYEEMTNDERADEILSWEFAEIGFAETYTRIQELLGRELFKHELYTECGGVQALALEARGGAPLGMLGIFAKVLLIPGDETVPIFVSKDQESVAEFLKENPEASRMSTIALIDRLEREGVNFEVVEFRPTHEFLVKASSKSFSMDDFLEQITGKTR